MSEIHFTCPTCNASMTAPKHAAGKKAPCPNCGQRLQIPDPPRPPRNKTVLGKIEHELTDDMVDDMVDDPVEAEVVEYVSDPEYIEEEYPAPPPRRRRPAYEDDYYEEDYYDPPLRRQETNALGVASLVLGCCSAALLIMPCLWVVAFPVSVIGLIFGAVGMNKPRHPTGMATAGFIVSLCVAILTFVLLLLIFVVWDASYRRSHYDW